MPEETGDAAPICLSCGLCCDGSLFARTQLAGEEIIRLGRRGATLSTSMPQPCASHRGGRCEIYAERPQVCRSFRCALLERYEREDVDRGESLRVIETAHAAQGAVLEMLAPGMSVHDLRRLAAADDRQSQAWRAGNPEVLARLGVFEDYLQKNFRVRGEDDPAGDGPGTVG